jgi:serine/threonine-protein kinase
MAVIGSFLFNRTLKQFLSLDDPQSSKGQALIEKIRDASSEHFDRILEVIPLAPPAHGEVLKRICTELGGQDSEEHLLDLLGEDDTQLRSAAREVLSESTQISPARLFKRLQDHPESAAEIIDIVEIRQDTLPPELMVKNALRLQGSNGQRLLEIATRQAARTDMERLSIDPSSIDAPDLKIALIRFLSAVDQPEAASLMMQMAADDSRIILIEALKGLKRLKCDFDPAPLAPLVADMGEVDRQLALEVLSAKARTETLPSLAPLACGQSDELRRAVTGILVGLGDEQSLEAYLTALSEQEWWGRDQALKCLLDCGDDRLFRAASKLLGHDNEFVHGAADQLAASRSGETADINSLGDSLFHKDWQVRERAIVQLGGSNNVSALRLLTEVQRKYPESTITILKAVRDLGFSKGLEIAVRALNSKEAAIQREALYTADAIATEKHADKLRNVIIKAVPRLQATVRDTARDVIEGLTERFGLPRLKLDDDNLFETRLLKIEEQKAQLASQSQETPAPDQPGTLDKTQVVSFQNIEELKTGDRWMDRFHIVREIGRGAMGRVMLVNDEAVGEQLILKFMHPELTADGKARERFLRELKYSRKISHPNVIRIHDFLIKDGLSAISMEYFESVGLDVLIKQGELDIDRSLKILHQVCDGLWEAHRQQVIHRDIKPSNILVNDENLAKVVDFGIASATSEHEMTLTKTGMIIGTPAYLSPERARGEEADHRSDIYALGIIAYAMFSGSLPYKGEPMSLLYQHIEGKATPLHRLEKGIPTGVSMWVQKMMAADIDKRFQTMQDARDTLAGLM